MNVESRRNFLKGLGTISALFVASRSGMTSFAADEAVPFEYLIVGDSLIWGQGLEEKDKFYTHIAEWLRSEAFGNRREVNLKIKAHSGSTLKFHPDEAEKYKKNGCDETYYHKPEVNVGFPSCWKQIEVAADEYREAGKSGADLIMICSGITDITTSRVYDPKGDDDALRAEIKLYCFDDMYDVLDHAAAKNPNAVIAVIGYYQAISSKTSSAKILNAWLEALSFPRPLKIFANNPIVRPMYFNKLKERAVVRARIWRDESTRNFKDAVEKLNQKYGSQRAIMVESPLTEDDAAEAPKTKLFRMGKGGVTKDAMARERIKDCNDSLPVLKRTTGIEYPVRLCEIAAVGHPDPSGARAYAEAIKNALKPMLNRSRS